MSQKNTKGFSLIDLMVAVAIIAILASVAIPNFLAFRRKAQIADARSQLGTIYKLEKIFFQEFNSYSARLDQIGFQIDGVSVFNFGFVADFTPPANPGGSASCTHTCNACTPTHCNPLASWTCGLPASNSTDSTGLSFASVSSFLAEAHGHLDNDSCAADVLTNVYTITIDQNGQW